MANSTSVFEGASDTMRCTGSFSVTVRPLPSVNVVGPAAWGRQGRTAGRNGCSQQDQNEYFP